MNGLSCKYNGWNVSELISAFPTRVRCIFNRFKRFCRNFSLDFLCWAVVEFNQFGFLPSFSPFSPSPQNLLLARKLMFRFETFKVVAKMFHSFSNVKKPSWNDVSHRVSQPRLDDLTDVNLVSDDSWYLLKTWLI